jgi:hypothetical protein
MNTDNLRLSVRNLIAQFGRTDSLLLGTIVNLLFAAVGVWVATAAPRPYAWGGVLLAALSVLAIGKAYYRAWGER